MQFPYSFTSPDEAQLQQRRHLLDTYGRLAQFSILIPLICYCSPSVLRFLQDNVSTIQPSGKTKEHASPVVSRFGEISPGPQQTVTSQWRRVRWLLDDEILPGWGTWRVLLIATLWTVWLFVLAIRDTGDDYLHLTKRFGIIAASQLPLHYLLAFKSSYSPISYLTRLSHEELNPYHRALGRILLLFFSLHASFYLNFFIQKSLLLKRIRDTDVILGLAAITSFVVLGTTALAIVRERNYFLFFILHVTLSLSVLPVLYFHVSHLRLYILESAAIYILLIIQRNISQSKIENATLEPVKGAKNLISITLPLSKNSKATFHPGQHIYLSLPTPLTVPQEKLRLNPFTVANLPHQDNHVRLVLRTLNGTTNILSKLAFNNNNSTSLLIEGPYGSASTFPNLLSYSKILLVAGGVGATFTIPIYRDLSNRGIDTRKLKFVWSVKKLGDAGWGLEYLQSKGCEIYCTSDQSPSDRKSLTRGDGDDDSGGIELQERMGLMDADNFAEDNDNTALSPPPQISLHNNRPNFRQIVQEIFTPDPSSNSEESSSSSSSSPSLNPQKAAILVCGPSGMGAALRQEVWPWVKRGREVWWHSEEFGW